MRRLILVTSIAIGAIIASFGCGGSATPVSEGTAPISIEALDGETGVGTDQPLTYGFDSGVDTNTVSVTNFFIQPTSSGECNPDNALYLDTVKITCEDSTCTFDPNPDAETKLSGGTNYTFCITSDIVGVDTTLSFSFTTEGEAPSTLSVSSVTDAASTPNTIETTGSTGIIPTSFKITFSEAMAEASVTTAGNITLTCADMPSSLEQPSITVALWADDADNGVTGDEYTVTVTDADGNSPYKFQMMTCTLTVATNVTNSGGTALAEAATYVFTNACAVSDDFNANSQSCWGSIMANSGYSSWDEIISNNLLTFNTSGSTLDYSVTSALPVTAVYKQVTVNSKGFEIVAHLKDVSGFDNIDVDEQLFFVISTETDAEAPGDLMLVGIEGNPVCQYTIVYILDGDFNYLKHNVASGDIYVRLTADPSGTTVEYSSDGSNYTPFSAADEKEGGDYNTITGRTSSFFEGNDTYLSLWFVDDDEGTPSSASIDAVVTSGITAADQY